jgi:hypothetical protein
MLNYQSLVRGQLLTPLTRFTNREEGDFGIDNGAFSGFQHKDFSALLAREEPNKARCLFVAVPDVVGDGRRTLEIFKHRHDIIRNWPLALVAQDGMENLEIPWSEITAIFVGGCDPWKDSKASLDIVRTAKTLGKHVHVGRVNTFKRFDLFAQIGADTCDGSGVAIYSDEKLGQIQQAMQANKEKSLWETP